MFNWFFKKQRPLIELPISETIQKSLRILRQQTWNVGEIQGVEEALRHLEYIYGHPIKQWSYPYRRCLFMRNQEKGKQIAAFCFLRMESLILG